MQHIIVVGGGVIGLSVAYELAHRNFAVTILERDRVGRQTSWAGAGILPPVNLSTAIHPFEQLEALSTELHEQWSERLKAETGIDNEFSKSGGLYVARTSGERAALVGQKLFWSEREIGFESWGLSDLHHWVPALRPDSILEAVFLPTEYQVRNPQHLKALECACRQRGVTIVEQTMPIRISVDGNQNPVVTVGGERLEADHYCVAAGAWSQPLMETLGVPFSVTPVRGQMVLFKLPEPIFKPIINEGTRYLVPRHDGHVLVGATVEEVGFDSSTNSADIDSLVAWAESLIPECNRGSMIQSWAGLRPGSFDGFPFIGLLGESKNISVATGHFKSGLHLSTATAVVLADLVEQKAPRIDLRPFDPNRAMQS